MRTSLGCWQREAEADMGRKAVMAFQAALLVRGLVCTALGSLG